MSQQSRDEHDPGDEHREPTVVTHERHCSACGEHTLVMSFPVGVRDRETARLIADKLAAYVRPNVVAPRGAQ